MGCFVNKTKAISLADAGQTITEVESLIKLHLDDFTPAGIDVSPQINKLYSGQILLKVTDKVVEAFHQQSAERVQRNHLIIELHT